MGVSTASVPLTNALAHACVFTFPFGTAAKFCLAHLSGSAACLRREALSCRRISSPVSTFRVGGLRLVRRDDTCMRGRCDVLRSIVLRSRRRCSVFGASLRGDELSRGGQDSL